MRILKRLSAVLAIILTFSLCICQSAYASEQGSITVTYAVSNAKFFLYRVGETDENGGIQLTGDFSDCSVSTEDADCAQALYSYASDNNIHPLVTAVTDNNKTAEFTNLQEGVYLLAGESTTQEDIVYTAVPSIIYLPEQEDNAAPQYNVSVNCKHTEERISDTTDKNETTQKPDGTSQSAQTTAEDTSKKSSDTANKLPQTGQLWWPVPVMLIAGMLIIIIGLLYNHRKAEYE